MHPEAVNFTLFVKSKFPQFFSGDINVLDVGSGDINGNNRFLFDTKTCHYVGNDVGAGPNVSMLCKTSALPFVDAYFTTICSTECFEHDPEWSLSFRKIVKMLKPGGLFFFTCASTGRPEHGTRRTSPQNSLGSDTEVWQDHYHNITLEDLQSAIDLDATFSSYQVYYCSFPCDIYFWGVKKATSAETYSAPNTSLLEQKE